MSKATKRKHVTRQVLEEFVEPEGSQKVVRVLCGRGNNLHEVEEGGGARYLASMPTRFRRNVWIKRGDYVIVEPIAEGQRVQAEIVHILYPAQVRHLMDSKLWPLEFCSESPSSSGKSRDIAAKAPGAGLGEDAGTTELGASLGDESDDDSDLFVNTNRPPPISPESSSSEEDS